MNRLESLDWLRGLLAVSIMIYHLTGWKLYEPDSNDALGRLGVYGVSVFFVLSGLSMALVYREYICDTCSALRFFTRRIFRIWPLLWLAVFSVTLGKVLFDREIDWILIALNLTTAFGFISPSSYINTGAWSIGNEMVYYALTPPLIILFNKRVLLGNITLALSVLVGIYFAFEVISNQETLADQWRSYINPLNNLFFYCAGISIYYNFHKSNFTNKAAALLLLVALAIFLYYPASGDQINIVTGTNRCIFSLTSILMVIAIYKSKPSFPKLLSMPLTQLGIVTYGVYLLHPIVFQFIDIISKRLGVINNPLAEIFVTVVLTIAFSLLSFKLLEAPLIRIGKVITSRKAATDASSNSNRLPPSDLLER